MQPLQMIDHSALRTNQAVIIGLLVLGFILNLPWMVALTGAVMLAGSVMGRPGFGWLYLGVLRPLKIAPPDPLLDNRQPHVFAQAFGGVVLAAASLVLLGGAVSVGWALAWLVVALAALNLFVGFCAGCAMYYWLNRLKVPGFNQAPPPGVIPGLRPRSESS